MERDKAEAKKDEEARAEKEKIKSITKESAAVAAGVVGEAKKIEEAEKADEEKKDLKAHPIGAVEESKDDGKASLAQKEKKKGSREDDKKSAEEIKNEKDEFAK